MEKAENPSLQPLGRLLSRTGKSFLHLLNSKLKSLEINRNYYALLIIANENGSITQNELAAALETDKVSVVRIVDYLTDYGYIQRVRSSSDRRKYCLGLTSKGKTAVPGIREAINEVNTIAFESFTGNEIQEFERYIRKIKSNLSQSTPTGL